MNEKEKQAMLGETEERVKPATPPAPAPASPEEKVSHVTRLVVGKGRTSRPSEAEEWIKEYYELEAAIIDDREIEVAKSTMEGIILGWLTAARPLGAAPAAVTSIPNVDLHDLEHDSAWRSWKKDERGTCPYPAKEGRAAWIRISRAGNTVLTLIKGMKRRGLKEVNLGLFAYKLSGEDFLQRRPLKEPEPEREEAAKPGELEDVKAKFPSDLEKLLTFSREGDFIVVKPREYLGSENFSKIASIIREAGGEYLSLGKSSHFRVKRGA